MNYSDYMIVEKWKNETTEEIVKIKNAAKKLVLLNTEWFAFLVFILVFTLPTFVVMISNFTLGLKFFTIDVIIYALVWFFYLKPRYINQDMLLAAKERCEEMETVLKYR